MPCSSCASPSLSVRRPPQPTAAQRGRPLLGQQARPLGGRRRCPAAEDRAAVLDTRRLSRWLFLEPLDEALALREGRRARRWLLTSSVPLLYVLGSVLLPWIAVPALYASF